MKKSLSVIFAILAMVCVMGISYGADKKTDAPAVKTETFQNAVSVNVIGILIDWFEGSYERAILPNITAKADIVYSPNIFWASGVSVFDLDLEGRYYFSPLLGNSLPDFLKGSTISGLFAGAGVGFISEGWNYSVVGYSLTGSYFAPTIHIIVGDKWLFKAGNFNLFVEPYVGFRVGFGGTWSWKDSSGNNYTWASGVSATGGYDATSATYGANFGMVF